LKISLPIIALSLLAAVGAYLGYRHSAATPDVLVLDLSDRGLDSTELYGSEVHFDFNNDGFAEQTAWLANGSGFLILDKNQNGKVDDVTELLGYHSFSGLSDLARYDDNDDGVIDAKDHVFSTLKFWRDQHGDGVSKPSEISTVKELGITAISLSNFWSVSSGPFDFQTIRWKVLQWASDVKTPQGNSLYSYSTYTRSDGTEGGVYGVVFDSRKNAAVDLK
jgi:hypothetical protein